MGENELRIAGNVGKMLIDDYRDKEVEFAMEGTKLHLLGVKNKTEEIEEKKNSLPDLISPIPDTLLSFEPLERWRAYPGGGMAAHVIGLIGYLDNELAGRYGLERFYEPVLRRSKDSVFVNFFAEIFSNMKKAVDAGENFEGDIVTTIEPSVEAFLESEVKKVTEKYTSDFTGGIVINPKTGEIFAVAFTPTFDPNFQQQEKNSAVFRNRSVEDRYEMGSIIKALPLAAGLDSGAITAKSTYNDPGCMTLNTRTFCNYDGKSHGSGLSMQTVLNKSLNTGAAFVTSRMGNLNFSNAMLAFGLDTTTGIDLP